MKLISLQYCIIDINSRYCIKIFIDIKLIVKNRDMQENVS